MGTNYYAKLNYCKECGRGDEIHLGKSSMGWKFSFQFNGGEYYKNVSEMKEWLKGKIIENEYGEKVPYKNFWEMVKIKQKTKDPEETDAIIISGYKFFNRTFS